MLKSVISFNIYSLSAAFKPPDFHSARFEYLRVEVSLNFNTIVKTTEYRRAANKADMAVLPEILSAQTSTGFLCERWGESWNSAVSSG